MRAIVYQAGYAKTDASDALTAVESELNAGNPLIVLLPSVTGLPGWDSQTYAHYVAVMGYDPSNNTIFYADPAKAMMSTSWQTFSHAWGTAFNGDQPYQYVWSHKP